MAWVDNHCGHGLNRRLPARDIDSGRPELGNARKGFLHLPWSVIFVPGLVGTLTSVVASFIGWPTSEVVGGFVAYRMVAHRLARRTSVE